MIQRTTRAEVQRSLRMNGAEQQVDVETGEQPGRGIDSAINGRGRAPEAVPSAD